MCVLFVVQQLALLHWLICCCVELWFNYLNLAIREVKFFMSVADRFKSERERLALTQPRVAELTGVGKTTVINWEKALSSPTAVQLSALAEVGLYVLYVITGQRAGGVKPAPTLTAEEETMLSYFRDASKEVRRAALGALLGASAPTGGHASGSGQNNVGDNAIQIGSVAGKARIKNR